MKAPVVTLVLGLLLSVFTKTEAGYGDPSVNYDPSYDERLAHALSNAVRVDPSGYKNIYMAGYSPSVAHIMTYPQYVAVPPLLMNNDLGESSHFHSNDMDTNEFMGHDSSDGTDAETRINRYYFCGSWGENVAWGYTNALSVVNGWLCDETGGVCADDYALGDLDGHRRNIMGSRLDHGISRVGKYWTQDFGECPPDTSIALRGGSHLITGSTTKFMANYYGSAPSVSQVIIGSTSHTLTLELGSATSGHYIFETAKGSSCREYYFKFVDGSGKVHRFPENGNLVTTGESCAEVYRPLVPPSSSSSTSDVSSSSSSSSSSIMSSSSSPSSASSTSSGDMSSFSSMSESYSDFNSTSDSSESGGRSDSDSSAPALSFSFILVSLLIVFSLL